MRLEVFVIIAETGFTVGLILAAIYATLSFMYHIYRYAKGDNHPEITDLDLNRKNIVKLVNPFYYKHPIYIVITAASIISVIASFAIVWPVIIPVGIIYYTVKKIREKNLHKKKMWETLKGS